MSGIDADNRGRDEFMIEYIVMKANDRKIFNHKSFEEQSSLYWQLMRQQPGFNQSKDTINFNQYLNFMKRVYKVLLPLYRETEVVTEVTKQWKRDSTGLDEMSQTLFQKLLFTIAHYWCIHIDVEEYVEFLEKLYNRIIVKKIIRGGDGEEVMLLPEIYCELNQEVKGEEDDENEWKSCFSSESQNDFYQYEQREDPNTNAVKMYKRKKQEEAEAAEEEIAVPVFSSREAFMYKETVKFFKDEYDEEERVLSEDEDDSPEAQARRAEVEAKKRPQPNSDDTIVDLMADMDDIFPMGYPTEQFIAKTKNEVVAAYKKIREEKKKALAAMKREIMDGVTNLGGEKRQAPSDRDPGLLEPVGCIHDLDFVMFSSNKSVKVRTYAKMKDVAYNALRNLFKEFNQFFIRPIFEMPRNPMAKQKQTKLITSKEPDTVVNTFGYNCALERRLTYKTLDVILPNKQKVKKIVNVNYLVDDPMYDTAFRSDVQRVETNGKLANKVTEDFLREEEFCNVTTPFRDVIQIMLVKKFETFFTNRLQQEDPSMAERSEKIYQSEAQRKQFAQLSESLDKKDLYENYEEKNFMRDNKGPFYSLMSREGIQHDNFATCAVQDLIASANTEAQRIMVIGKPRIGRTTLTKALATQLDLVRISTDLWIEKLLFEIQDRKDNEDNYPPKQFKPVPVETEEEKEAREAEDPPRDYEEPEPEEIDWKNPLQLSVYTALMTGESISEEDIDMMLKEQIASPAAQTKGFLLDVDFSHKCERSWVSRIQRNEILGEQEFSHVIELMADDEEMIERATNMRMVIAEKDPDADEDAPNDNGKVFSRQEREERNKPAKEVDEDAEEEEEETEPLKPFQEDQLFLRICDEKDNFLQELDYYNTIERPAFDDFIAILFNHTYIKLDVAGMSSEEITEAVKFRVKPNESAPNRPIAKQIEDGGDFKGLLTDGIEMEEGNLARQWSLWRQTDPVALFKGVVLKGDPSFAADYANNVFVFANEENMKEFLATPKKFLQNAPEMPPNYRMMIFGPSGSGVDYQAQELSKFYGWKIIDFDKIVRTKLAMVMELADKPPNNVRNDGPCMVSLSQEELDLIKEGKKFESWKFIPWILEFMGIPLAQRPPPPPPAPINEEDLDEAALADYKKKQAKEAKELAIKQKAEEEEAKANADYDEQRQKLIEEGQDADAMGFPEREIVIKIDDLNLEELIPAVDEETGVVPALDKFIMVGFPKTELHMQKLRQYGFEFDRIVYLTDENEEEPGKALVDRHAKTDSEINYDWEAENAKCVEIVGKIKAHLATFGQGSDPENPEEGGAGDEAAEIAFKQVDCSGDNDKVFIKIRTQLDPFFTQIDNPDDVRVTADLNLPDPEAEPDADDDTNYDKKLPKSDFGDYCPVTFVRDGFLAKGNPEVESTLLGKSYLFAGEPEQEEFKFNPEKYLIVQNGTENIPLPPPMPKIMICGQKGSGVTTQISMLCEKYKLQEFELMKEYLTSINAEKAKRRRVRLLNRGYKPTDPEVLAELEPGQVPEDPELDDEGEEFDKEVHEKAMMKDLMAANKGLIIDGNWTTLPEEAVVTPLQDLLVESRRMPEMLITLKCKEETTFKRCLDDDKVKEEFENINKKIVEEWEKELAAHIQTATDDAAEKLKEASEQDPPEEFDVEKAIEEAKTEKMGEKEDFIDGHADKPDLEEMMTVEKDKLREQREKDEGFLEEFVGFFKEKGVQVVENMATDISPEFVFIKLQDILKNRIRDRKDLIEREQAQVLKIKEVPFYEKSYTFKPSCYGENSPCNHYNPEKTKEWAVLYRQRIYYCGSEDEQKQFLLNPSLFTNSVFGAKEAVPSDLIIKPAVSVVGLPKSGKTTLCETIAAKTGCVYLKMEQIIEEHIKRDANYAANLRQLTMVQGGSFEAEDLIKLLVRRLQNKDCRKNGWVIENFPQTKEQAILMAKNNILPQNVFNMQMDASVSYKRAKGMDAFDCIGDVLKQRIQTNITHMPQVHYFFQKLYDNVQSIDACRSRWFVEDLALRTIQNNLMARSEFARDYYYDQSERRPCVMDYMPIDRLYFKQSVSQYGYHCPVSWKMHKKFVSCAHRPKFCVLYRHQFFYFASGTERAVFIKNPRAFTEKVIFSTERNTPMRIRTYKASEVVNQEKAILGHCPVTLKDEGKVEKGLGLLIIKFKDNTFVFTSEEKMDRFFACPGAYADATLPVKMPPTSDPVHLNKLQSQEESITFLEQALGTIVTRGLREVGDNRLKYPTLTVKETMLKLFAIFLKAENPANTVYMKEKYHAKMRKFIENCEVPEELNDLADEKSKKEKKGKNWPQFKEDYYNQLGQKYDEVLTNVKKERKDNFQNYIR